MDDFESQLAPLSAGEITPHSPAQPLAPAPQPGYPVDVDYLGNHAIAPYQPPQTSLGTGLQAFGQALPSNITQRQFNQVIGQMAALFSMDLEALGYDYQLIRSTVDWFRNAIKKPEPQEPKSHAYNLYGDTSGLANAFGNFAARHNAPQGYVASVLWWVGELEKRVNTEYRPEPAIASAGARTLSDAQLEARAEQDAEAGLNQLRIKWGSEFDTRLRVVKKYYAGLPEQDKEYFENAVVNNRLALNDPEVVEGLYFQAIGGHNLPKGGELATEIAAIEKLMRTDRKSYNRDEQLQMRYRQLLELRDGS